MSRAHVSVHIRHDNIAEADPVPTAAYIDQVQGWVVHRRLPPPYDHYRALGIGLLL